SLALLTDRDNGFKVLQAGFHHDLYMDALRDAETAKALLEEVEADLADATATYDDAKQAYDDFANDWDTKAFPVLEVTEDKIRLGFAAGSGEWEDFAYLEMTKDGI